MKPNLIHAVLAALVLAISCPPAIADQTEKQAMQTTKPVFNNAQDYIEFFRQGGEYYDKKLPGLMISTQPDPQALKALGEALLTDGRDVRKKIIDLLNDVRRLSDPVYELRSPEIIALMVGPGFAKTDGARDDAMDILMKYASTATLSRYGDVFLKALKEDPEGSPLMLIAKAKPKGAWEEVDRLSKLPEWKNEEAIRIARAALGDTKIEDEYIADAKHKEETGDANGLAKSFRPLVEIGTQRSLQAVCRRMRSPLITVSPGVEKRSVRLVVMDALTYAFPEEWKLLGSTAPQDVSDEDYIRVERFCTKATGVRYDDLPRPPFFTIMVYPTGGY